METEPVKKKRKNYNKYTPVPEKPIVPNSLLTKADINLASRLKMFRTKYIGKTLQEASDETGIPPTTINGFELFKNKVPLTALQVYKNKFGLNLEWATTGKGADKVGDEEKTPSRTLQELITTVNTFSTQIQLYEARLNSVIKENSELRKRVAGLEEDMRHLNTK